MPPQQCRSLSRTLRFVSIRIEQGLNYIDATEMLRNVVRDNGRNCSMRKGGHTLPGGE